MKLLRKTLFWSHLVVGVIAGAVVLIMSVTGVLLTYQRQITAWADTRAYVITPPAGASRLSPESLVTRFRESRTDAPPATLTIPASTTVPAAVAASGNRTFYLNPYSGEVLGEGSKGIRDFFRVLIDWHRWLGASGENRASARAITGACNLGFLFLVASGLYLWWPKKLNFAQLRNITWFKRGLPGKARDFNWHNVIGFWCFLPLFIVVLSGVVISYPWASNLVYRVVGEAPPAPRPPAAPAPPAQAAQRPSPEVSLEGVDRLWARAEQQVSGWQSINLRLPTAADAPLIFTIDSGDGGQPQKRATLTLDRATGNVSKWEPFSDFSAGRRLRSILRFAHTGEVLGMVGQTIAGLASLGGVFLVYTGIALALRRLRSWVRKRSDRDARSPVSNLNTATQESSGD